MREYINEMKEKVFERKQELLDAALEEFTKNSYENASLNDIIKNAGISKGTFYYHFQDKQALYLFLLESSVDVKMKFINEKMSGIAADYEKMNIFEAFGAQARIGAKFAAEHSEYQKLSAMFLKEKGKEIYEIAKTGLSDTTEKFIEVMVKKAAADGDFREGFSEDFILKTVSYLFIHFDEIYSEEKDRELEEVLRNLDDFVDFLKNGLGR